MNVTCPSCETVYRVDPTKVPAGGVRARCAVCSNVFPVNASVAAATAAVSAGSGPAVAPRPPAPPPAPPAPPAPPTPAPAPPRTPAMPRFSGPIAAPPPPPAAPAPPAAAPRAAPPPAPRAAPPPAPAGPAGAGPGQRMTSPLRPVNPFMVQDPKQKARRLARALVSDLVVYHPEKRQQGLRDGTLPQLFKDEIEKSWREYVEQV